MQPKKNNKLLFIILALSLVFIGIFAIYYFYFRPNYVIINLNDRSSVIPQKGVGKPADYTDRAFPAGPRNYMSLLKSGIVVASEVKNEFSGKITTISREPGDFSYDKKLPSVTYAASISLMSSAKSTNQFFYTEADLQNVRIIGKSGNGEALLNFDSLKIGDQVHISETINPLKSMGGNRKSVIIIRE
jgi:hypothetical protein